MLEKKTKVTTKTSVYVYYLIGLTWLIAAFVVPMIKLSTYLIMGGLTCFEFILLDKIIPKDQIIEEYVEKPNTGNLELDEVLVLGNNYLNEIIKANESINDVELSDNITEIENTTRKILMAIEKRPSELNKIRKFMSYYLPTTIKLLKAYADFESHEVSVENVEKSMQSIKNSVGMITSSFEKLLNSIYEDDLIDITSDIDVYEKMVSIDGYKGIN